RLHLLPGRRGPDPGDDREARRRADRVPRHQPPGADPRPRDSRAARAVAQRRQGCAAAGPHARLRARPRARDGGGRARLPGGVQHEPRRRPDGVPPAPPPPGRARDAVAAGVSTCGASRGRRAVRRRGSTGPRRAGARRSEDARGLPASAGRPGGDPPGGARRDRGRREGRGQGDGARDAAIQGTRRRQAGEPDRARGAGRDRMNVGGGAAPSVLETLEFPAALERVAAHAAGPLGAARVRSRTPATDPAAVRDALAQVAELAALLLTDDAIRAEPVPDIGPALELLAVPGGVLEGPALAQLAVALVAARVVAGDLARLAREAPRTATLRVEPPPKALETRLRQSLDPEGNVLDGASRDLARARQAVREARERLVRRLEAILGGLDAGERAPDASVTLRGGRYVIPIKSTARARIGGIVHDESATRATVFVEPP